MGEEKPLNTVSELTGTGPKQVVLYTNDLYKMRCDEIDMSQPELKDYANRLSTELFSTLYSYSGAGIAASQIGVFVRMAVIHFIADPDGKMFATARRGGMRKGDVEHKLVIINPTVLGFSDTPMTTIEGCLSLPNLSAPVTRPEWLRLKWQDLDGDWHEEKIEQPLARCVLHELDHMDGIFYIHRVSSLKRDILLRKHRKAVERGLRSGVVATEKKEMESLTKSE